MPMAKADGVELYYETHGDPAHEPLLLIMGLGSQMTRWPAPLYKKFVAKGLRVIRFDNRDVGLSSKLDAAGAPDMPAVIAALQKGERPPVAYTLAEMAADAVAVLDAAGAKNAHVAGVSMGGMIGQVVTADYPDRVLSFTSIMSSTGNPSLPRATPEAMAVLTQRGPDPTKDLEGYLAHSVKSSRVIGSPGYPFDEAFLRARAESDFRRAYCPTGFQRQYAGVMASPDRREKLKTIKAPTVVIHGEADPLVPLAGGRDTAENIPGAELRVVPGMGHDIPPGLYDTIVDGVMAAVARARVAA